MFHNSPAIAFPHTTGQSPLTQQGKELFKHLLLTPALLQELVWIKLLPLEEHPLVYMRMGGESVGN